MHRVAWVPPHHRTHWNTLEHTGNELHRAAIFIPIERCNNMSRHLARLRERSGSACDAFGAVYEKKPQIPGVKYGMYFDHDL